MLIPLIAGLSVVMVIDLPVASIVLRAFSRGVGTFLTNCTGPNLLSSLRLPSTLGTPVVALGS
jgi:ABC-type sulfate transport system permease subunit